jgi:hypothetical protein
VRDTGAIITQRSVALGTDDDRARAENWHPPH